MTRHNGIRRVGITGVRLRQIALPVLIAGALIGAFSGARAQTAELSASDTDAILRVIAAIRVAIIGGSKVGLSGYLGTGVPGPRRADSANHQTRSGLG